ncbi:MAG: PKD domain-containing protein, partial [Candidatus Peregrinibacteria bacterium]|nr:PKD domain-containing protein [Candidatus Peregrinibacteria bacterium]
AAGTPAPKKIGKEKKAPSKTRFLLGCAGAFIFLFILFIVVMVLMISRSGASNPVMQAFGLDPGGIRVFLQGVVGFSFGMISLLFLVLAVIGLFKLLGAQKGDKEKRGRGLKMFLFNTVFLIFMIFIWVFLANYIGRIEIATERVIAEIVVLEPEDISTLEAPVTITFSALNVATALQQGGVQLEGMNWDLDGDGVFETPVTDPQVTHLYNQRGSFTVGLQVKVAGEDAYRAPYTKAIVIQTAVFDADPATGTAPQEIQFDASGLINKDDAQSLDWDFDGDGLFDMEGPDNLRPRHTFEQIGTYKVRLRVIDKNNNVQSYTRNIEITASSTPILSANIDVSPGSSGAIPLQLRFDAGASKSLKGTIVKYQWDFGDGSDLQSGRSVSHVFDQPGFYTIELLVVDSLGNQATGSVEIEAESGASAPEAVIQTVPAAKADEPLTGTLPFKVEFDASASLDAEQDIVVYQWDFDSDDAVDAEGKKATHTFEEAGTYTVRLSVEDAEGQADSVTMDVVVEEPGVIAVISATPQEGTAPLVVQFDGSSSSTYVGNIVSYEWDFGDASPKTVAGAIVSHKYNDVGSYEARLRILTDQGESAAISKTIFVREVPLRACFTPSRTTGTAPLTVTFDSKCSTGSVFAYHWSFGDGAESTGRGPTYTFEAPGTYTVTLEVADAKNNVSTVQQVIEANPEPLQ